ncbi:MAG: methyltransferase domain-containing protein [Porticoccus sp.]|uniref:methyltransferase domain-containing protein n=1 Tax=Porticoccus sp. TaxID=2024853 RepID=UPI003297316F
MNLTYRYLDPKEIIETDDFKVVESFLRDTGRRQIGWHYIVDLTWIYSRARQWPKGLRVLDAGGGRGPAQFLLAEMGFDITNIDLVHTPPDYAYLRRYGTVKQPLASHAETRYVEHIKGFGRYRRFPKRALKVIMESLALRQLTASSYASRHEKWRLFNGYNEQKVGRIDWLTGNLCDVPEMEDGFFDAVVSMSALEHIPLDILPNALAEIRRLVKPDGHWAVTTSGAEQNDTWYHAPSLGYCFSEKDLNLLFGADAVNTVNPHNVLRNYHNCSYLKDNLAFHYRLSGNNGMPWGRWSPSYIPVGLAEEF